MKVLLHYPKWGNRWEPYVLDALSEFDVTVTDSESKNEIDELSAQADVLLSMWCNQVVGYWTQMFPDKKIITYLRRFELWSNQMMGSIDFSKVDGMIWINHYYREAFFKLLKGGCRHIKHYYIPNGIDLAKWKLQPRGDDFKIALVASMKHVKNIPLAAMILKNLPPAYHIHHIGLHADNYTGELFAYIDGLGLSGRWHWEPRISSEDVYDWLKDKSVLLNPSVNEGNPNCVIEAMAMGIKPVIHAWPGARGQFPDRLVFETVQEACVMIKNQVYEPAFYRSWVETHFPLSNFGALTDAVEEVANG